MSTRGYVTLIDENKNIQMAAFISSDAYLSYYGLQILDAIAECRFPEFIDKMQKDYPEELNMVEGIERNWYIRGAKNKDDFFHAYAYEVNSETQVLTVYNYGDKALTIPYDQLSLYRYIFEHDNELYPALCLDERTMTLRKDEYKEIRDMVKAGADIPEFKALIDKSSDIVFMDMGRMKDALCYNNEGFNKEVYLGSGFSKTLKFCVSEILETSVFTCKLLLSAFQLPQIFVQRQLLKNISLNYAEITPRLFVIL